MTPRRMFLKALMMGCAALALPVPKFVSKRISVSDVLPISFDAIHKNEPQLDLNTRHISVPIVWTERDNDIFRRSENDGIALVANMLDNAMESCRDHLGSGPIRFSRTNVEYIKMSSNKRVYCMHIIGSKSA